MTDFMEIALKMAQKAFNRGEVPVGAVIGRGERVISAAFNQRERHKNALHHAEVLAIDKACRRLGSWRLDDCVMYVTLEPCQMCMGAAVNARLARVVYGAKSDSDLNWKTGADFQPNKECSDILKKFFAAKRG